MIVTFQELLETAEAGGFAVGAFNVYNLEGVSAVIRAAETEVKPVILQLLPSALRFAGTPLVACCLEAARNSSTSVAVHLDHSSAEKDIQLALDFGLHSVMVDGSHMPYAQNLEFTRRMCALAHERGAGVEAELGRLTGAEDGINVPDYEAKLTDPDQAEEFIQSTGIDALAVCIGNVHGHYRSEPRLDFERLKQIKQRLKVPLVLHGASGSPEEMVRRSIELGVRKINVNTEVREAYIAALHESLSGTRKPDLIELMEHAIQAMQTVIRTKIRVFGSIHELSEQTNP